MTWRMALMGPNLKLNMPVGFADGGPVPAFVVAGRVGPVEVFEYFDGKAQGNGVVDAVLHAGEGSQFEEVGVLGGDVVVG